MFRSVGTSQPKPRGPSALLLDCPYAESTTLN